MVAQEYDQKSISVDAIIDYMACGLFYKLRHDEDHSHEVISAREIMATRFENTLKKVASYYFYKKQGGAPPSYTTLLRRWEKLWFPKNMTAYDMALAQLDAYNHNIASYSNVAAASIEAFHNYFSADDSIPIMINEDYDLSLTSEIRLVGTIDLVLKQGNHYKIVKWFARRTTKFKNSLLMDIAALKFAFEKKSETRKAVSYHTYNLANTSANGLSKIQLPSVADTDALIYWATKMGSDEGMVPRRGLSPYCKGCPFDAECLSYDWETGLVAGTKTLKSTTKS